MELRDRADDVIEAGRARRLRDEARLTAAVRGLRRFLTTPTDGLWFDQLAADDRFVVEPARATSLYHIVGAVAELQAPWR